MIVPRIVYTERREYRELRSTSPKVCTKCDTSDYAALAAGTYYVYQATQATPGNVYVQVPGTSSASYLIHILWYLVITGSEQCKLPGGSYNNRLDNNQPNVLKEAAITYT